MGEERYGAPQHLCDYAYGRGDGTGLGRGASSAQPPESHRSPPAPPTTYRYRQFQELHTSLSALGLSAATLPRFPRKYSYKTQDERFVAKRREELEEYLAAVVADRQLRQCAELHQFLELGLLLGQIERGAGSRGMDRATR